MTPRTTRTCPLHAHLVPGGVVRAIPRSGGRNEGKNPAKPPVLPQSVHEILPHGASIDVQGFLELVVGLPPGDDVDLQHQQPPGPTSDEHGEGGLQHDDGVDGHYLEYPGEDGEDERRDKGEREPPRETRDGEEARHDTTYSGDGDVYEKRHEIAMVVVAHTLPGKEAVVVSPQYTPLAGGAVVGPGRGVIAAVRTVVPARLRDHGERNTPTGCIRDDGEYEVGEGVDKEEGHDGHCTGVTEGVPVGRLRREIWVCGPDGWGNVQHPVQVGGRDHEEGEAHCNGVDVIAREVGRQPHG